MNYNMIILISVLIILIIVFVILNICKYRSSENYANTTSTSVQPNDDDEFAHIDISNSSQIIDPHTSKSYKQDLDVLSDSGKFSYIPDGLRITQEDIAKLIANNKNRYLDDTLFANVITYENDNLDNNHFKYENTGLYKCLNNHKCSYCVEYGVTGTTMCFPEDHYDPTTEYYNPLKAVDEYKNPYKYESDYVF